MEQKWKERQTPVWKKKKKKRKEGEKITDGTYLPTDLPLDLHSQRHFMVAAIHLYQADEVIL